MGKRGVVQDTPPDTAPATLYFKDKMNDDLDVFRRLYGVMVELKQKGHLMTVNYGSQMCWLDENNDIQVSET